MRHILFLDDGDLASMRGLTREVHPAQKYAGNPVLVADQPWEQNLLMGGTVRLEPDRRYRMWYQNYGPHAYLLNPGYILRVARPPELYRNQGPTAHLLNLYAESEDGIHWTKPFLGQYEDARGSRQNNIFLSRLALRCNYLRPPEVNQDVCPNVLFTPHLGPECTYTLISYDCGLSGYGPYDGYFLAFSSDGLRWRDGPERPVIPSHGDAGWFTFDEVDRKFRGIVQTFLPDVKGRFRRAVMSTQSNDGYEWTLPRPAILPDTEDETWTQGCSECHTQFYGMPIARYESVFVGLLQVFRVTSAMSPDHNGEIDVQLTCSRDGRRWSRVGNRRAILELGPAGAWDAGMVLTGNSLVVQENRVLVYYTGWDNTHSKPGNARIGMAWWRRDRLAGLRGPAEGGELLTTFHIAGSRLHVNADASGGELSVELVGHGESVIEGYDSAACERLRQDTLDHVFRWPSASSNLSGRSLAVRLRLRDAEVFSLWWD